MAPRTTPSPPPASRSTTARSRTPGKLVATRAARPASASPFATSARALGILVDAGRENTLDLLAGPALGALRLGIEKNERWPE